MRNFVVLAALLLIFANAANAASPFGVEMGQPLSELDVAEDGPKPMLNTVPNPHPDFTNYFVWAADDTGVCLLIAGSSFFDNDRYGVNVRNKFDKIVAALESRYGVPTIVDRRLPGGLWDEADEWVMSIRQNERVFAATWSSFDPDSDGANLQYLELSVLAMSSDKSVLRLIYKFENVDECIESIESEQNSSF